MVEVSIAAEGIFGLTWPAWKRLVRAVEDLGFAGLYLADHFVPPAPPEFPNIDLIVALTYLADHTERIRFGPLVAPLSHRDPVHLAFQAAALDDLSGGRLVLGVGAGWAEREHEMYGYALGDVPERMARLEEGVQVITSLLRAEQPVSFEGTYFQLRDAVLPRASRSDSPPILVGASGLRRGLPLVARFADIWNTQQLSPEGVRERSAMLDDLLVAGGREPSDVLRTLNAPIVCGRSPAEMEARLHGIRRDSEWGAMALDDLLASLREWFVPLIGTPEQIVEQIAAYGEAGIAEVTLQWFDTDDVEGLQIVAKEVLPHVT